ncbi:MAG: tetratricopeptide repeat protein [Parabacteroides sp.]|nr:tetratricopeptide repeat protein [Parabacteroides sp.]
MRKGFYYISICFAAFLLWSCSTKKNTKATRFYHAFNSRYNIYFNGKTAFDEALKAMQDGYKENYSDQILMYPISAQPKEKQTTGGPFDRAIEKGNKAIKLHSIKAKPPKKPGWKNDPKQRAWQEQEEYNPFLKHCWLLVGEAQFYNADFLQASATFSYIARHYAGDEEMVAEARLWQARSYAEMGWFYEAEDILSKLNTNGIPKKNLNQYAAVYADYLIKEKRFEDAIPYLKTAIKAEKNGKQRARMRYLLGQLYADQELDGLAYQAFQQVIRSNPPYELEFAARIRQTEVFAGRDYQKVVKTLKRMAKSQKNQDYLDQVYYALGNVYLNRADTTNAITYYQLGIDSSKQNGMDKALCQIKLGDLYFQMRDYIHAQPCFSGALAGIQKEYKDYPRVSKLSAVLDELVVHAEAVHQQDSLQALAKMPEAERLAVIDKAIADLIKQEEEEKKQAEKEAYLADQEAKGTGIDRPGTETNAIVLPTGSNGSTFYFYNPQTVAQGKTQFQKKWGRRTLEDNWRRKKKELTTFNDPADTEMADAATETDLGAEGQALPTDSLESGMDPVAADDPHQREYYLQQLPFTQEDIDASNVIIIDGLYNMAMIYKDKLEDLSLSVEGFEELERRFPENEHLLESYYQVYLIALRTHDGALAAAYKQKLIDKFADSDYAVAIADPNYEYNIRMMDAVQDSIYEQTYTAYLADDTTLVRRNYQQVSEKYPLANLLPKFMFLEALTYVQAGDPEGFKAALKALLEKYPKADVSELAGEMLKGVLRGRAMVQGGVRGMSWDLRFGVGEDGSLSAADSARVFTAEPNTSYKLLLMYPEGSVDKNQLLFAVAAYNFANFMVKEFDLTFQTAGPIEMLQVSGFVNFDEILHYYKLIYGPDGYASALDRAISVLPISDDNYETLMHGKTLDEYITFFAEHFGELAPELVTRWQARMEEETTPESVPEEADLSEPDTDTVEQVPEPDVVPEAEEPQPTLEPIQPDTVPQVTDTMTVRKDLVIPAELIEGVKPDTVPVVEQPQEDLGLSLKEIQEIRKQQAAEEEVRKEEARKAFEEQQQTEKALQAQKAQDLEAERKRQAEQEKTLLKAKADREKQLAQDRKAKLKQAEADRKAKMKAREQLRKEKEKAYKAKLKEKEKERKAKEKAYKEKLKERERARKRK